MLNKSNLKIIAEIHPQHNGSMNEIKRMKKHNVNEDTNTLIERWTDYYNTSGKDVYGK